MDFYHVSLLKSYVYFWSHQWFLLVLCLSSKHIIYFEWSKFMTITVFLDVTSFRYIYIYIYIYIYGARGGVVVKALCYKPAGHGYDSRWCYWNFSFRSHYGPGVESTSNRNEYQVYFLGVKAAGA